MNLDSSPLVGIARPVALAVVGLIAFWKIQRYLCCKRTEALKTEARVFGLSFEGKDWADRRRAPLLESALFAKGNTPQFRNIIFGSRNGLEVSLFDYSFVEGHGKGARRYTQTVGCFSKAGAYFPYFRNAALWDS